ncbi:MAG: site-specific integrase [Planctomycetes bacterium]|nr:site-specific integrase [Planctomycetota bacterium]
MSGKPPRRQARPIRQTRFREAIPDYRTLLENATRLPLEVFPLSCFSRWGERWGLEPMSALGADNLQAYFRELALKGHELREIEKEKALLRAFYRWARRSGWTEDDPTEALERTRALPEHPLTTWTGPEQDRLLATAWLPWRRSLGEACAPEGRRREARAQAEPSKAWVPPLYLHPLVLMGLRCGLRLGHVLHLEWRHVDHEARRIRVPACEVKGGRDIDLPVDADVHAALSTLRRRGAALSPAPVRVLDPVGLPLWKGAPDEHAVLHAFRLARKQARIPEGDFNSLRLTFARNCARAGVPMSYVLRVSDWDDPSAVQEVYGVHAPAAGAASPKDTTRARR